MHRVIVQGPADALDPLLKGKSGKIRRALKGGAVALEVDEQQLDDLKRNALLTNISGDLAVTGDMAVTNKVTHATDVWQGSSNLLGTPGYTGTGVAIAILDSGIASHPALDNRVLAHVNLVSDEANVKGDTFGHGTHIAGIAAGNRTAASSLTPAFAGGTAPSALLVDVRVLDSTGAGRTSDVIAGIDWVIDNRVAYNIRVINLSLGHAVTEPSATDPLCRAVLRAVAAGITVVVSAGNYGQTTDGAPALGGVTSPGNSPFALTVGAIDTKGTLDTGDDVVAPYSSRGPTAYEFAVKPDVVAPGTRIVSLEAQKSYLGSNYPQWHIAGASKNAYMRLSGTSMATAVVSGGAALLLNAEPWLTPVQVKMALQMGARFMPEAGLVGAGAGSVNFAQSLKIAHSTVTSALDPALSSASGLAFQDGGTLIGRLYDRSGLALRRLLDRPLVRESGSADVLTLLGLSNPLGSTTPNYLVWGNTAEWSNGYYLVWGNTIQSPSGQYLVWGNNEWTSGNYLVWGNTDTTNGNYLVWGNSLGSSR